MSELHAEVPATSRDRLLDAAERCLRRDGIRRTTMAGVAEEAGISRAWLYRQFPDKSSLLGAALVRLDEAFWESAHARLSSVDGIAEQVAEAVALSRTAELAPFVLQLREQEPEAFAAVIGTGVREIVPGLIGFWQRYLVGAMARGEVRADLDPARAAEWVLRLVLSLATVPGDAVDADDPRSVLAFVREFLVPGLT
ncbi:MAG: transcriptional regulator, TetR family [Frankiales bacterium]|nr:transcriptional regulator, TetR family [Frankiales bacterium]